MNTIFDRSRLAEDQAADASEEAAGVEKIEKLLREHNTEIFEPKTGELETPSAAEVDKLMKQTASSRPVKKAFPWRIFALAASALIVCGIAFVTMRTDHGRKTGVPTVPTEQKPAAVIATASPQTNPIGQFRGPAPAPNSNAAKAKGTELAYLADAEGMIKVRRPDGKEKIPASCEILYEGDVVVMLAGARGKLMYPDAIFDIKGPMRYRVAAPDPVTAEPGNAGRPVPPTVTTRGNSAYAAAQAPQVVMSPKTLLDTPATPITRDKSDGIDIYSPKGDSFSDKPVVRIGGDPALTYTVTILDVEDKAVGKPVAMRGDTQRPWTDFTDAPLAEDESYTLVVRHNGRIVNGLPDDNRFRLLPKPKRDGIAFAFKVLDTVRNESERAFFRAGVLYKNGCYSEAYAIAASLAAKEPGNALYQNLKTLTGKALRRK